MILVFFIAIILGYSKECQMPQDCSKHCRIEYGGTRNYYNSTDGLCYPVVTCDKNQVYVIQTNSCVSTTIPDLPNPSLNNTDEQIYSNKPSECIHGILISGICKCNEGYSTNTTQDMNSSTIKYCNIPSSSLSDSLENSDGSITAYLSNGSKLPLSFGERIGILVGVAVLLCILSHCIVSRLKRKYSFKN
jgi:hypothetical protein